MISPDDIDALAVARRVLASPKSYRLSVFDELAMAGCLVALDAQIDMLEANPTNARLAAVIAAFIQAEEAMAAARTADGYYPQPKWAAREAAFKALKTTFEMEFPHA